VALAFAPCGEQLAVVTGDNRHTLHLISWRTKQVLFSSSCHNGQPPQVYGLTFNPFLTSSRPAARGNTAAAGGQVAQGRMFVTYGVKHLRLWVRSASSEGSSGGESWQASNGRFGSVAEVADVLSACFLPRDWLVTGAPCGELLLWDVEGSRGGFGSCAMVGGTCLAGQGCYRCCPCSCCCGCCRLDAHVRIPGLGTLGHVTQPHDA
jgi:hypothetical protein